MLRRSVLHSIQHLMRICKIPLFEVETRGYHQEFGLAQRTTDPAQGGHNSLSSFCRLNYQFKNVVLDNSLEVV